ncbi:unnamed protein product [Amoebophrya sp. A120]|nr:unnamed protein product [Amoebophrya sp. A120]|eukprot:GSA120T00013482001.1
MSCEIVVVHPKEPQYSQLVRVTLFIFRYVLRKIFIKFTRSGFLHHLQIAVRYFFLTTTACSYFYFSHRSIEQLSTEVVLETSLTSAAIELQRSAAFTGLLAPECFLLWKYDDVNELTFFQLQNSTV